MNKGYIMFFVGILFATTGFMVHSLFVNAYGCIIMIIGNIVSYPKKEEDKE